MRFQNSLLLVLANYCFAAKYSVDSTCRSDDTLFNGIKGALQEGIDLADNALTVMTDHADNQWVQKMAKYILGTDDFDNKFSRAKDTFTGVVGYEREPSQYQPQDDAWKSVRSNADLEVYCGSSRFTQPGVLWRDGAMNGRPMSDNSMRKIDACYKTSYVIGSGASAAKAMTMTSNMFNGKAFKAAEETNPNARKSDYLFPVPTIPCTIDICTWFTTQAANDGWAIINTERVDMCKTDKFKAELKFGLTPIDGLKTIGSTMLHELTHTIQGGTLIDILPPDLPENVNSCYNWVCIGGLKNERNADSIAMLGITMKIWSLKHYAEDDGTIHPIP